MTICFIGDAGHVNLLSWIRSFLAGSTFNDVHVITFNEPCEEAEGITFHQLKSPLFGKKLRYITAIPEVKKLIKLIKPDIVIGYRINSYGFLAVMTGFHPVVAVAQGSDLFYPVDSKIQRGFLQFVIDKTDLLQTWESHMGRRLIELGADKNNMLVMPKGIDTDIFKPAAEKMINNSHTMISTRQLRKTYNHDVVLKAIPLIKKQVPDIQYLMCGDGEYKAELKLLSSQLGIEDNVTLLGKINHRDLPNYLNSSQVYVSMQSSDGVSASLLEAMACGLMPVVTDIEANRLWIRDGQNGLLVTPSDHIALAAKIISAFESDASRKMAVDENLRIVAERGCMKKNMLLIEERYLKLIEHSRTRTRKR